MQLTVVRGRVQNFVEKHKLFQPGDTVVVACSGGADSMALLDILANLSRFDLQLVVAHINHLLRGTESDADELAVSRAAEFYGCGFASSAADVAALAAERGWSLEEAGREARYEFLRSVASQHGASAVAVGHHKGDQAETVLMRLLRGAGGRGLAGMLPKTAAGPVVRPLLCLERREIEDYLRAAAIPWREDESNTDDRFLRNRVRHGLLPQMVDYNPGIVQLLNQTAEIIAADEAFLDEAAATAFARVASLSGQAVAADLPTLRHEPLPLRLRVYRLAIAAVKGDLRRISYSHLTAIDRLVFGARPNGRLILPGEVTVVRGYERLLFTLHPQEFSAAGFVLPIERPGLYQLPCGASLLVEEFSCPEGTAGSAGADILAVAPGQLSYPLEVRYFRRGDRFIPLGMQRSKKLKNLFIDRKIPLASRSGIPLLIDRGEIVWVCGVQLAERMRRIAGCPAAPQIRITYEPADRSQ